MDLNSSLSVHNHILSDSIESITYTDDRIISSPIDVMIGYPSNTWMIHLAETLDELSHVLLYSPDRKENKNSIYLFFKDDIIAFVSDKGVCYSLYTNNTKYTDILSKDADPLCVVSLIKQNKVYPEDLFWSLVDMHVQKGKYRFPREKYDIYHTECYDIFFIDRDTYIIDICLLIHDTGNENIEDHLGSLVENKYLQQGYIIKKYDEYYISRYHITFCPEEIEKAISERSAYIIVRRGTIVRTNGYIFRLQKDIKAIDIRKVPDTWYDYRDYLEQEGYILWNTRDHHLYGYYPESYGDATMLKIYVKYEKVEWSESLLHSISFTPEEGYRLHCFYIDKIEDNPYKKLPPESTLYTRIPTSLYDVSFM